MGGIAGIQYLEFSLNMDKQMLVQRMLDTMKHRAPHCHVEVVEQGITLGVRYHQQKNSSRVIACDDTRNLWVILDGELFYPLNAHESKEKAISDAEIILQEYWQKGLEFLNQIDGSYSIAIWDGEQKRLLLARDRFGVKPLFYLKLSNIILFASEIKAILASKLYRKSVNLKALNNFLSYGYVPNPDTLFDSIQQVRPGHLLIYQDGKITEQAYWKFSYRQDKSNKPEAYYKEKFLDIFETAVSRRLKRHHDCGAFLSGGLDTSAVVAVMHKLKQVPFKVFTAGFEEERYNEISDAKLLADHMRLDHITTILRFNEDFPKLLEKIVWHHDAPFSDTSAIPSYFAAKLAKEHVNTVLTGDFPDQLLGGSEHHAKALAHLSSDPLAYRLLRNHNLNNLVTHLRWSAGSTTVVDKIKRLLYRETFPLEEQRIILNMPVPELLKRCLYSPDMLKLNSDHDPLSIARSLYKEVEGCAFLDRLLYFDIFSYAPDDLMVKVDRMTSAHGLNAISPFHDLDLVEFIATLPTDLKIKGTVRKYIMKEALKPLLPEYTLNKKKKGFDMPIAEWLTGKFPNYVRDILLDSKSLDRGYFNKKFMRKMVKNFLAGKTDYASGSGDAIISLITLELWHRVFIDN